MNDFDFSNVFSSATAGDPTTPIFTARAGQQVRLRVVKPAGHTRQQVLEVHGHAFQDWPYVDNSNAMGNNPLSEVRPSFGGIGPSTHFDMLFKAGGALSVPGDYMYRDMQPGRLYGGFWGIMRVTP
jgi:hypothetical protein